MQAPALCDTGAESIVPRACGQLFPLQEDQTTRQLESHTGPDGVYSGQTIRVGEIPRAHLFLLS